MLKLEYSNKKVVSLELDRSTLKSVNERLHKLQKEAVGHNKKAKVMIKCRECGRTFSKACELEEHGKPKDFKCETCGKEFFLEWRLNKHANIHLENSRLCKYVKNQSECPFEKIGCMFKHEEPEPIEEESDTDDEFIPAVNQCHICRQILTCKDDLFDHIKNQHYYQDALEGNT